MARSFRAFPSMDEQTTVIDVRSTPFWRRLAVIVQAFDRLAPGEALELVVDLDPWPLKTHLESTRPGQFGWRMLQDGPECWRTRLSRI
jgi:uncharacterized protein (DUF2249 family)